MFKKLVFVLVLLVFGFTVYGSEIKEISFENGDKYVGTVKDGQFNGQGTFTFFNESKYGG